MNFGSFQMLPQKLKLVTVVEGDPKAPFFQYLLHRSVREGAMFVVSFRVKILFFSFDHVKLVVHNFLQNDLE